jgi:diketogulonate reductase-like aldo/keto reductase
MLSLHSTRALNNGIQMPVLGFGTYKLTGAQCEQSVSLALNAGYRLIDTASYYQNEREVGLAIAHSGIPRSKIFLTTKLWNDQHEDPIGAFNQSLSSLSLDYIDLYLIHWPVEKVRNLTWKALQPLLSSRKARALGVSNFLIPHLEELLSQTETVPAVNQLEFSPFCYHADLLDYCKSQKIQVMAFAPLTRTAKFSDPRISHLPQKYSKSMPQIFLRWSLQHGMIPIPKATSQEHMLQNTQLFDFELSSKDMALLDTLNEDYRISKWDPSVFK